ncbi:MAG: hypothetical protein OEY77_01465 [Nitrospira sp.]|nr:hypothetical protein [Nitrospira sp.]
MPAVGGRIGPERLLELGVTLGRDAIFVLGVGSRKGRVGLSQRSRRFIGCWRNHSAHDHFLNSMVFGIL